MRQRTLKPSWLTDPKIAKQSDRTRLLSATLILLADDWGVGIADPTHIVTQGWAHHLSQGVSFSLLFHDIERGLHILASTGFITIFECRSQEYYSVKNWSKHQYVKHPSKTLRNPSIDDEESVITMPCPTPTVDSTVDPPDNVGRPSGDPAPRKDRIGKDRKGMVTGGLTHPGDQVTKKTKPKFDFESVYKFYPKKRGKRVGLDKAKAKIKTQDEFNKFSAAVKQVGQNFEGRSTKFCPHFSTFVNQELWKDEELPAPSILPTSGINTEATKQHPHGTRNGVPLNEYGQLVF